MVTEILTATILNPVSQPATAKKGPGRSPDPPVKNQPEIIPVLAVTYSLYQTRQLFAGIIGWPTLQLNALPNSSKFCTLPFVRH